MRFLILLLLPVFIFAGRVSQWSDPFLLSDPDYATLSHRNPAAQPFPGLTAKPNPFNPSTILFLPGLVSDKQSLLKIFDTNGRCVSDLTPELRAGSAAIVWKADAFASGLYLARLKNGNRVENLKLMLIR